MINLSELSLKNKTVVWYFIIVAFLAGIYSYFHLGRMEDPAFNVRIMVVSASWPGATAKQMAEQVTDKLERKFQNLPGLDNVRSVTQPGVCSIYIELRDDVDPKTVRPSWRDVRGFGEDVKRELPAGVYGPFYNDRFDDVYGSLYALTGDGYTYEEMRRRAEKIRRLILQIKDVQKVELVGVQPERVYIEVETARLAGLGLSPTAIAAALNTQNEISPAAMIDTATDNVYLRITGVFDDVDAIRATPIRADGRVFRLGDIATVERRSVEPAEPKMFFDGCPAIGVAVSMENGGNVLELGQNLDELVENIRADLPVGLELNRVSDQPHVVDEAIGDFTGSLREAVVIVLIMSFLSLGVRTGVVVGACIPLVLAGTFCVMYMLGIDLHKVSLGALIISLGLLVDDEIIAVEMMSVKLEEGLDRMAAACYAFTQTAAPMLYGTLITCAGFIPVAFSKGTAAEFCSDLFAVIVTTLLLSWIVSVMVTPLFGSYLIKTEKKTVTDDATGEVTNPMYQTRFYVAFRRTLEAFLRRRKTVLAGAVALFLLAMFGLTFVKKDFFPASNRPELILDMRLPIGSSLRATEEEAARLAAFLDGQRDKFDYYSHYVGVSMPRFVLTINPVLPQNNLAQFLIQAKDVKSRDELQAALEAELAANFPNVRPMFKLIQTGPPVDYPVMLRVSGYDADEVRRYARQVAEVVAADPNNYEVNFDWFEKSKALRLTLDQDKLRQIGISGQEIAQTIYTEVSGASVAEYYRDDRTIKIDFRLAGSERQDLTAVEDLPIYLGALGYVPLGQLAKVELVAEDGLIWRRDTLPTITVQANIRSGTANDATKKAYDNTKAIREKLPLGYSIKVGGALENSEKSLRFLKQPMPAMLLVIMSLLMILQKSFKALAITLLTLPLGLIGVVAGMLIFDEAMGFVAILGVLSLSGMIVRNSIILIDQIQKHEADGFSRRDAIISSAMLRFRPIMLTAGTSMLGMVPLMTSSFWGPMAVAIAAGLFAATALTLLVLPVMYAAFYRVAEE